MTEQHNTAKNLGKTYAAIDLGSNSFHLMIAAHASSGFDVIERHRKRMQLAKYLEADGQLSVEGLEVSVNCLREFAKLLQKYQPDVIRAVGTNTIRIAQNQRRFLCEAEDALGVPVSVLSGEEEARLVYQGATLAETGDHRCLVIDIGGGSTEVIVGQGKKVHALQSIQAGCVSLTKRYFSKQKIAEGMKETREAVYGMLKAWRELKLIEPSIRARGCSGSIRMVAAVLEANKLGKGRDITAKGLEDIYKRCAEGETLAGVNSLPEERADHFPAGLAVLCGLFDAFGLKGMELSDGALREGLLYSLLPEDEA